MALSAINRRSQKGTVSQPVQHRAKPQSLFDMDDEDELPQFRLPDSDEEDPELAVAVQASLDSQRTLVAKPLSSQSVTQPPLSKDRTPLATAPSARLHSYDDNDDLYASPSRLETALSIAGAGPPRRASGTHTQQTTQPSLFGTPSLLLPQQIPVQPSSLHPSKDGTEGIITAGSLEEPPLSPFSKPSSPSPELGRASPKYLADAAEESDVDDDMEEIAVVSSTSTTLGSALPPALPPRPPIGDNRNDFPQRSGPRVSFDLPRPSSPTSTVLSPAVHVPEEDSDHSAIEWSRSPSPIGEPSTNDVSVVGRHTEKEESWDAAQEMDPHQEAGEFARFISQMKGRDLDTVRVEIDEEIRELNRQKKAAIRDSEDITQHMISQIMVCASYRCLQVFGVLTDLAYATPIWYPVYHRANGSGGAMR